MWTVYEMACFLFHVQWTSSCDHAATSSAVLHRVSLTSGWCLRFSSSTVFFLVVNRDRYPQLRFSQPGSRVLQYIDKVVDVPGDAVALWRLVKEFHIFSTCCSRSSPGIWTLFLEPLVLAAICPCVLRQSTEAFGRISSIFYVKSGPGSPRSSHLEI